MRRVFLLVAILLGLIATASPQEPSRYDVVIRGGRVLDGTGNPFFHADVAVDAGELTGALAGQVLTPQSSSRPAPN